MEEKDDLAGELLMKRCHQTDKYGVNEKETRHNLVGCHDEGYNIVVVQSSPSNWRS